MAMISADSCCLLNDSSKSQVCPSSEKSSGRLLDGDVTKIVQRKLGTNNFRILRWSLDNLGETNGFLGQYYTLSVTVNIDDKSSRCLKFFVKTPPPTSSPQYDFLVRYDTFNKEILVYSEIVPRMGLGHGTKWLPDYYLSKSNSIIVLEDAKQEGYVTPDKYIPFDEDHCVSLLQALATFHSRSLILDEKLRRTTGQNILDVYGHALVEVAFVEGDVATEKFLSSCCKGACAIVDLADKLTAEEAITIKDWINMWVPRLPRLLEQFGKFRKVICHRDVWPNNIMFKRDSRGKPIGCYLVDFQFLRYSPPAMDFVLCLLLTTDRDTRRRIYDQLVDVYYNTVKKELALENLVLEECLSRAEFLECCDEVKGTALAYCVSNMQIMLLTKEAVEEYFVGSTDQLEYVLYGDKRSELAKSQCRSKKAYQTRITEIIEEIKEYIAGNSGKC